MLVFKPIDLNKYRDKIIEFRKDSFVVSFGSDDGLGKESDYIDWVSQKMKEFPDGFTLLEKDGEIVGQVELSIREYSDKKIGYIHLYYLIPEQQGSGMGKLLHNYAINFFKKHNVTEYHLRVSPTNSRAINFYRKLGMEEMYPEFDGKVIRMKGYLKY